MFVETGKKFIESFSEIKNKNLQCLLYRNVADDVCSGAFYRFGLS